MTRDDHAKLVTSAAEIGRARWNALANPHQLAEPHPFTTYEFFAALEESGSAARQTGWQPAHLVTPDGLLPLYLKSHSYGEYVFDHAWAEALERAGGDYYPKLQGAVPFTPVTGRRLLANSDKARATLLKTAAAAV
ncbi:MAG TPA: peptidogalycan biosysnthesis protein, partial [Rhizomicrobium sp.]|nr:peptidogalycan biosysnthesis protein [Rhizomicrobium sp.]